MKPDWKKIWENKIVRYCILGLSALLLLLMVWKVFFSTSESYGQTEQEARLVQLLVQIEGIDGAQAYITTDDDGAAIGAIVIYEGKDEILVRMRILDIVSSALNLQKSYVQVYPASA